MELGKKQSSFKSIKLFHVLVYTPIIIMLCACKANHGIDIEYQNDSEQTITIQASVKATRILDESVEPLIVTWASGDAFCFFDYDYAGDVFHIINGVGSEKGVFSGSKLNGMTKAIYPVACRLGLGNGFDQLMLPLTGQVQIGNNNNSNLSSFYYMIGQVEAHAPTNIVFNLLVAQVKWILTFPTDSKGVINKLEISVDSGEELFIKNLSPSHREHSIMASKQSLVLQNAKLDEAHTLTAYMMVAPVTFVNQDLTIKISMANPDESSYYYATLPQKTVNIQAGNTYLIQLALHKQ